MRPTNESRSKGTVGRNGAVDAAPSLPISVVVRSYKRPGALLELVGRLRSQRYPTFEVVILEQSEDPELVSRITSADDPRIRVIVSPQRDPPAARNEAVRHATGNVLLFIDDDDLPIGSDWIALHARNYADPRCMGVVGRAASDPEGKKVPKFPWIIRALAMRHTFFKDTVSYAHNTLRKESVDFLIGTNASVRRTLIDRIGGWDEGIPMHEEQSFAIKFHRQHRSGERFVFDPGPIIQRRTDLPGGLSRRTRDDWYAWELEARLFYYEQVVGHYFPIRYRLLCPLFVLRALEQAFFWIWDPDNAHWSLCSRLRASIDLLKSLPRALRFERFPAADVRRVTRIARYIAPGHGTSLPARRELRTPAMD